MRAAGAGQRAGLAAVDALTAQQVDRWGRLSPVQLRAELRRAGARGARGRRRVPAVVRRRRMPGAEVVNGAPESWSFGYLTDVILTRDTWMHRLDLARATSREPVLTPDHDGVVVADVVAEWARRHGQPFRLELSGPAGGSWSSGDDGEEVAMDAADFCRALSGREVPAGTEPRGLLATEVPF